MSKRIFKVLSILGLILFLGIAYGFYAIFIGYDCPILKYTGLKCPGCGSTRMIFSILELDFSSALYYNKVSLFVVLGIAFEVLKHSIIYIKNGTFVFKKFDYILFSIMILSMILYMILRNIEPLNIF